MVVKKNKSRGYQQLRVWIDAINYYSKTCELVRKFPYELKKVAAQAIASSDSIHRNIAEGYCRKSLNEYLQFLYIAMGSLGESVSGLYAFYKSNQISKDDFQVLDELAFKLENYLIQLINSLERKKHKGDCIDHIHSNKE
jgi:four helix bundle protein